MRTSNYSKPPFVANSTTTGQQSFGVVAAQSTGAYVAVWTDYSHSGGGETIGRGFDAQGNPATEEILLHTGAASSYNAVNVTPDNVVHVVSADNGDIVEYANDATTLGIIGTGFLGVETSGAIATRPAITSFADGSLFVTYTLEASDSTYNIMGNRISAAGVVGAQQTIYSNAGSRADYSKLASLSNGSFVDVFSRISGNNLAVYFQIRQKTGDLIKGTTTIAGSDSGTYVYDPNVAGLTNGGFATVWSEQRWLRLSEQRAAFR